MQPGQVIQVRVLQGQLLRLGHHGRVIPQAQRGNRELVEVHGLTL
jgi:hypothetical protein